MKLFKRKKKTKKVNYKQEMLDELKKIESSLEYFSKMYYFFLEMTIEDTKLRDENKQLKKQIKEMKKDG